MKHSLTLICVATSVEANACRKGIESSGQAESYEVLQTGMGFSRARETLEKRLSDVKQPLPDFVISSGFAGSWTRDLTVGSWVVGDSVESKARPPLTLSPWPFKKGALQIEFKPARMMTLAQISSHVSDGLDVSDSPLPVAVDMESYAWAEVCADWDIPFQIVRLISDNPDAPLPESVGSFAAISMASSLQSRFRHLGKGLTQLVREPLPMARFIARGTKLPALLTRGWQEMTSV
jgi:nucleoside phosphorylase